MMESPLIAIIGSVDQARTDYAPPLKNLDVVRQAAEQLGRELARAGYRIIVYSNDPVFIEVDVVRGYVGSNQAKSKSIQIRYPQSIGDAKQLAFAEQQTHRDLFELIADEHPNWQVSFYMSLRDANGVLLLGGANSALITGVVAQAYRIPLVSIATFGGSAQNVWSLSVGALATKEERTTMGLLQWEEESAAKLVKALGDQRDRLLREELAERLEQQLEEKKLNKRAILAAMLMLTSVALTILGTFWSTTNPVVFGILFFGTPLLAGSSGGAARNLLDYYRGLSYQPKHAIPISMVLGMAAGLIAALLFVVAQWASNPDIKNLQNSIPPGMRLLIPFELIIGFIAGLTLDTVFTKLQETPVVNVGSVTAK